MNVMAFDLFARGSSVEEVAAATGRALSTTWDDLAEFIQMRRPKRLDSWIAPKTYRAVASAVKEVDSANLKSVFDHLRGDVPYEQIRLVVAHLNAVSNAATVRRRL